MEEGDWEAIMEIKEILQRKLDKLSSESSSSQSFIFRVPRQLREVNERAYEPQIISIGPYHHGKNHLKAMEVHKVRYLRDLLRRREDDLVSYIAFSKSIEKEARDCYAETVNMESYDFVEMMVLDGLFVVELIRKVKYYGLIDENDALFKQNLNLSIVAHDLLLLENQLPFFVLKQFAVRTELDEGLFVKNALRFFSGMVPVPGMLNVKDYPVIGNKEHLLGLVHDNCLSSEELERYSEYARVQRLRRHAQAFQLPKISGKEDERDNEYAIVRRLRRHAQAFQLPNIFRKEDELCDPRLAAGNFIFIRSATELSEAGIRFKKGRGNSLFDIKFANGHMHIPTLIVSHDTERIFRNLIAYEQFSHGFSIFMDYARLMDSLINYADDVALLSNCGIIDNWLGSDEEVANMFNKLNDYVYLSAANFYYFDVCQDVNKHCRQRWNLWKVKLRQKYFQSPWDWILTSIVAATILLLLSLVQTIFSVLAYFK